MEELEKNGTSTQAEENTVSLASAQALADALAKIEVYTPTTWVDNSSPDIDAEHLNKPEQAIKRVTDALNSAVDVIKDLQSQVTKNAGDISTVNNNLSNQTDRVTQLYSDKVSKSDIEKNGVQIGNILKVYSYSAQDKEITAIIKAKNTLSHMAGILIVDQNQVMDIYSTGAGSGLTVISKTSVADTPTFINENKSIKIPLLAWSSFVFLCFDNYNISES